MHKYPIQMVKHCSRSGWDDCWMIASDFPKLIRRQTEKAWRLQCVIHFLVFVCSWWKTGNRRNEQIVQNFSDCSNQLWRKDCLKTYPNVQPKLLENCCSTCSTTEIFVMYGKKYRSLVYTTQVNSDFRARWLVNSEVISKVLFTSKQLKRKKLPSRVAFFTESDVLVP